MKKIPNYIIDYIDDWIEAVKTLLTVYKTKTDVESCPLCTIADKLDINFETIRCECLWVFFTGENCSSIEFIMNNSRLRYNRIRQLGRWLKRLTTIKKNIAFLNTIEKSKKCEWKPFKYGAC